MEEIENLHKKLQEVYAELESTQSELKTCLLKLAKVKKKYQEESNRTSDLEQQLKHLRHKVHKYKKLCHKERKSHQHTVHVSVQTDTDTGKSNVPNR